VTYLDHDWYRAALPQNVALGPRTWLHSSFAFLHFRATRKDALRVGSDTGIYIGTMFDLGPNAQVTIGDYCMVGAAVFCTNGAIVVGDYSLVSYDVVLADDAVAVPPSHPSHRQAEATDHSHLGEEPRIVLHDNVWVGARATLLSGARIGEGSIIGASTVVDFEVPPYSVVAGNPARIVGRTDRDAGHARVDW